MSGPSTIPPLTQRNPPTWGQQTHHAVGRPDVVPTKEAASISSHIKATIGLIMGWIWFLIICVGVGAALYYIDKDIRPDALLFNTHWWWWSLYISVVVLSWYLLKMFVSIFFVILKKIKVLSFAYYLIAPFKNNVNGIFWVIVCTASFTYILDGSEGENKTTRDYDFRDLDADIEDRIVRVFAALLICFIIFLVKRAIVLVVEIALYRPMEGEILEAQMWDGLIAPLHAEELKGLDAVLGKGPNVDALLPPGLLGWIKLVTLADEMRFEGMHAVSNRLPYGDARIHESLVDEEGLEVGNELFDHITAELEKRPKKEGEEVSPPGKLTATDLEKIIGNKDRAASAMKRLDVDGTTLEAVDKSGFQAGIAQMFHARAALQRTLNGRILLVHVTDDLLTLLAVFISAMVILEAFDIDFGAIMSPNLIFIACLTFIFAPFLRDFVYSLYLIFFIRPFDLGDYITVDAGHDSQQVLLVKRSRVMVTHFRAEDGTKIYLSNAILFHSKITNLSRVKNKKLNKEHAV